MRNLKRLARPLRKLSSILMPALMWRYHIGKRQQRTASILVNGSTGYRVTASIRVELEKCSASQEGGNKKSDDSLENPQLDRAPSVIQSLVFGSDSFSHAASLLALIVCRDHILNADPYSGNNFPLRVSLARILSVLLPRLLAFAHICRCGSDPVFPVHIKDG